MSSQQSESFIARRTESHDAEKIAELITNHTELVFGRTDVQHVIEHANLSITLVGVENEEVLGHMALFDFPHLKEVDQAEWEDWIHTNYQCKKASPINSLFVHLFVAKEGFYQGANAELLRATFMAIPLLQCVFLTTNTGTNIGSAQSAHMLPVFCNSDEPTIDLYVAHRYEHFPSLYIRPAIVEDADDLMPIFSHSSSDVKEEYGEFFLAELIESQDDHHKTIVADVGGHAIGFLSVTTKVDVDILNTCYQLESFHGLKHQTETDETHSVATIGTKLSSTLTFVSSSYKSTVLESDIQDGVGDLSLSTDLDNAPQDKNSHHSFSSSRSAAEGGEGSKGSASSSQHLVEGHDQKSGSDLSSKSPKAASKGESSQSISGSELPKAIPGGESPKVISGDELSKSTLGGELPTEISETEPYKVETPDNEEIPVIINEKRARRKQHLFKGSCNALSVQLFAIDDKYETRSVDLLPMVFQLFPDHEFLILSQPHSCPEFPLLSHFARVPPRQGSSISHELYVLHKCGLLYSFSVGYAIESDLPGIAKLLADLNGNSEMIEDVNRYIQAKRDPLNEDATPISALVAKCSDQVVGVVVLRDEEKMRYIRSHYNIEDYIYFDYHLPSEHAHLHHFILNPVFAPYAKHYIKECLRLSHKSCLYYPLYPDTIGDGDCRPHSIITALSHMVPIKPRRKIVYPVESLGVNAPLDEVLEERPPFALYHTNRKLTLEPKITVNSRVVIVGASDTAISFLETLIFSPHLYFTNLTLISPHSLPSPPPLTDDNTPSPLVPSPGITSYSMCYTWEQYALLGLRTWVNTVKQKVVAINRPAQYVVVGENSSIVPSASSLVHYDYLVLCTGTQYQVSSIGGQSKPRHVFTVNDNHEAAHLLQWVKTKYLNSLEDLFVIFGNNLDAYGILHAMLDVGIPPDKLLLACPDSKPCCPDPVVLKHLEEAISKSGIRVESDVQLKGWMVEGDKLSGVVFQSPVGELMEVPCQALVYADKKHVDMQAFKAMNDAYLVFDHRLVISADHATNDPLIFAAGPLTKYSRRYRADQWSHANYNSSEVGRRLALTMLNKLDPTAEPWADQTQNADSDLLPSYRQHKAVAVQLPGGYHYMRLHSPKTAEEMNIRYKNVGYAISTDTENGYMYLHLSKYSRVDEIVTLTRQPLKDLTNYFCLYNIHEKYLNNMVQRYEDNLIPDLYNYFREPWACVIFHDRFVDFMDEIREHLEILPIKEEESGLTIEEHVRTLVEENPTWHPGAHRQKLLSLFNTSSTKTFIEKRLFKYLQYNAYHLPMYAKPDMI